MSSEELNEFVAEIDRRGGPGSPDAARYYSDFEYVPTTHVDKSADPFSPEYLKQQLSLYRELSGRQLNQFANEHTSIDLPRHIAARNPYDHPEPTKLAIHLIRLNSALRLANGRRGAKLLDMGCGWGLSSELAAYLGFDVHAVDVNGDFIELVRARSQRLGLSIKTTKATFDQLIIKDRYDIVLFYECLHHAVTPWTLLEKMTQALTYRGKIAICGEPINEFWWSTWGLRLDPISVYCIRKHGWFESGWSKDFLIKCLDRCLLETKYIRADDPEIGPVVVASKDVALGAGWLARNSTMEGAELDESYIVVFGHTRIHFETSMGSKPKVLILHNFRLQPVRLTWWLDTGGPETIELPVGQTKLNLGPVDRGNTVCFRAESWIPADEIGNNDHRRLAFQISDIEGCELPEPIPPREELRDAFTMEWHKWWSARAKA